MTGERPNGPVWGRRDRDLTGSRIGAKTDAGTSAGTGPKSAIGTAAARRPSGSSRAIPVVMAFVGVAIVVVTQAVQRGIVTGVTAEWPAYLVGGVLIVLGVLGFGRGDDGEAATDDVGTSGGPVRESGRDPSEADEAEILRETLRRIRAEQSRQRDDGGR